MTLTPRVVGGPLITERQVTKCSVAALICDVDVTTRAPNSRQFADVTLALTGALNG